MADMPLLWKAETEGQVKAAALQAGLAAAGCYDGTVHFFDLKGQPLGKFKAKRRGDKVMDVSVSPGGTRTAVGTHDGDVYLLDENRKPLWTFKTEGRFNAAMCVALRGEAEGVVVGCYDGRLYLLGPDGQVRWSLAPGSAFEQRYIWSLSTSSSGHVAVGTHGNEVLLLSPEGKVLWNQKGREAGATVCVAMSARGDVLWSGSDDRTLSLLDARGKVLRSFPAPGRVRTISADRRGSLLAVGTYDGRLYLYDAEGKVLADQAMPGGFPWSVCLSPSGATLAAGSSDKGLYIYAVAAAVERAAADLRERAAAAKASVNLGPVFQPGADPEGTMARVRELRKSFYDRKSAEAIEARLRVLPGREKEPALESIRNLLDQAKKKGSGSLLVEAESRLDELETLLQMREALAEELKSLEGPERYAQALGEAKNVEGLRQLLEDRGERKSRLRKALEELEARLRALPQT
ncbi:MAG: PQQ-binding-like beta-propeller repeat protein [Halobacteria archaeon]